MWHYWRKNFKALWFQRPCTIHISLCLLSAWVSVCKPSVFSAAVHSRPLLSVMCTAAGHSRPLLSVMSTDAGPSRIHPLSLGEKGKARTGKETAPGSSSSPYYLLPNTRKPYINIHAHPKCKPVFICNTYHIRCAYTHKYIQTKKTTHKDRHTNTTQINVLYHIQ